MDGNTGNLSGKNMYREEHLQKKSNECADLWREWFRLYEKALGAPDARRAWCKCCDEFSIMCHHEATTNPRYKDMKGYWNEPPPPPPK